ncbi:tRNA (adenine(22)-N(1))-methyltransferase [Domibacillus enclensis]|uniref:SAM-dependent methyltransferase n=1 Tax=Domibacillus enclensis TaxID=1017273 RepID=A0A1N6PNV0_9BACI|nr:tRNA (adenine(22)-N(1))-methyltransferase TrmK [Domibacillus enclensis]OXS80429.1 SAM-dependent methyltransferase [Domibacillus enclensis]SIQ05832.1 tRNA (adenine22-N1)-methyltransferase [Domibacillus enclensis]
MNSNQLSKRLETVVSFIHPAQTIADIGSDHAYLPCYAVKKGLVKQAVAGEVVDGPFQAAKKQVAADGLSASVDVRKGSGLSVLSPGEVECITIAGMGGPLIASILEEGKEKLAGVQKLVLQPNIAGHAVRSWLVQNNWTIEAEAILEEDGKLYEVISAVSGKGQKLTPQEIYFGPFLMKAQNDAFRLKWQREFNQIDQVLAKLSKAALGKETEQKKQELTAKKQWIQDVMTHENT